mgnify:FL=1
MEITGEQLKKLVTNTVEVGDVYRVKMTVKDGVTPKDGDDSRNKFFVVLGFDDQGTIYGGVIINSKINQNVSQSVKDYHMPISCEKYKFLDHDSFVNRANLKTKPLSDFVGSPKLGTVDDDDVELIKETIKNSPNEKKAKLKQFGLLS